MELKATALTWNVTTNGSSTPDWTQDIGQSKSYYMDYEGFNEICVGLLYYQVQDFEEILVPLGKGGRRQSLANMDNYTLEIASVFDNIYVNGIHLDEQKFIMFVLREERETHHGRRQLKFSKDASYKNEFLNDKCIRAITKALGCTEDGSWIVTEMNINREPDSRPRLDFEAVVVDPHNAYDFSSVNERNTFIIKNRRNKGTTNSIQSFQEDRAEYKSTLPLQLIYFGAPGTSKSTSIKQKICDATQHRITFHPDTDYSNFVGCYKPTTTSGKASVKLLSDAELGAILQDYHNISPYKYNRFGGKYWQSLKAIDERGAGELSTFFVNYGGKESDLKEVKNGMAAAQEFVGENQVETEITYEFVPQVFVSAYIDAWNKLYSDNAQKAVYLVIEEINRGNCAQIFGDLFQLLDRDDNGYSDYEIEPDSDLQRYLAKAFRGTQLPDRIKTGEVMQLPPNLYIWATMNTSDQSLFPIDSAFKRRWEWKYLPIKNDHKGHVIRVDAKHSYDWWQFLEAVNTRIEKLTELEDKQLGYWFAKPNLGVEISVERFVSKVVFYLWNDVFKDYGSDGNSPFVVKQPDDKKVKLKFTSFFSPEGDALPEVVTMFIEGLGVENLELKKAAEAQAYATPQEAQAEPSVVSEQPAAPYVAPQPQEDFTAEEPVDDDDDNDTSGEEGGEALFNSLYNQ